MSRVYVLYDSFELQIHRFNEKSIYAMHSVKNDYDDRYVSWLIDTGENRLFKYFGDVYEAYSFRWISKFIKIYQNLPTQSR